MERACSLSNLNRMEDAFVVLEDTISLLEAAMKITEPVTLNSRSVWLEGLSLTAQEDWCNPNDASEAGKNYLERCIYLHWEDFNGVNCYMIFPSLILNMLKTGIFSRGNNTAYTVCSSFREDLMYQDYIRRTAALVEVKSA